jgi:Zn-dependent protease with chaperone function
MQRWLVALAAAGTLAAQVKEIKPSGWNLFSPEQDIQLGREAAEEVRRTMPVVNHPELTGWLNRIGARLTKSRLAGGYPYSFEVIHDPSINAFALPGGPMFVNTGLIAAVENESELAGVLAHEISHVKLRHGTANVSKANLIQLPALIGTAMLDKSGGLWGALGKLGIGLGAESVLLRYSRGAEKDADLNGQQMMNDVGYDPKYSASFFEKLRKEGGDPGKLERWFSSHPAPADRAKYLTDQARRLPKRESYFELEPESLPRMKQIVASLPPPAKPQAQSAGAPAGQGSAPAGSAPNAATRPSGRYRTFTGNGVQFDYPDNWEVFADPNAHAATIAARQTLTTDRQGRLQVGYGMVTAFYFPPDSRTNLNRDTQALIRQMVAANPGMRQTANPRSVRVGGQNALLTRLESPSPYGGSELDWLLTAARPEGLFYLLFIAPETEWNATQPAFDATVNSLRFP